MPIEKIKAANGRAVKDAAGNVTEPSRTLELDVNIPGDLDAFVSAYGSAAVYQLARKRFVADVQAIMRNGLVAGTENDKIVAAVSDYKPGAVRTRGTASPFDKVMAELQSGKADTAQLIALKDALRKAMQNLPKV